jgi:hypothetical protein
LFTEGTGPANTVTGKSQLATVEKACGEYTYHCRTVRRLCKGEIASFGVLRGGIFCNSLRTIGNCSIQHAASTLFIQIMKNLF